MESRSFDRLPAFTDAVVAIAMTLLVLPLAEFARDIDHESLGALWGEHWPDVLAFVLSFVVIATYWRIHHQLFESVQRPDRGILGINTAWMLGVVFFPVPTAMIAAEGGTGRASALVYLLSLLYMTLAGLALAVWIRRHPGIQRPGQEVPLRQHIRRGIVVCAVVAVAAAAALLFGRGALFVLLLLGPAQALANRVKASPQMR